MEELKQLEQLAVKTYKETTLSMASVAKLHGVTVGKVKYWLRINNVKPRLGYTPNTEKRKEAAKMYLRGDSVADICKVMDRSRTVIYRWLRLEGVRD